jgi:hypothetical protein
LHVASLHVGGRRLSLRIGGRSIEKEELHGSTSCNDLRHRRFIRTTLEPLRMDTGSFFRKGGVVPSWTVETQRNSEEYDGEPRKSDGGLRELGVEL